MFAFVFAVAAVLAGFAGMLVAPFTGTSIGTSSENARTQRAGAVPVSASEPKPL